jgi:hypothetical protein
MKIYGVTRKIARDKVKFSAGERGFLSRSFLPYGLGEYMDLAIYFRLKNGYPLVLRAISIKRDAITISNAKYETCRIKLIVSNHFIGAPGSVCVRACSHARTRVSAGDTTSGNRETLCGKVSREYASYSETSFFSYLYSRCHGFIYLV